MMDLRQDPERVTGRVLALGALVVVVVILASAATVVALAYGWRGRLASNPGESATWDDHVPVEVSHVESAPYERGTDAERDARAARAWLSSFGWADRARGTVHLPIDVATELYLSEGAP